MADRRHHTDIKIVLLQIRNDSRDRGFITGDCEIVSDPTEKFDDGMVVGFLLSVDPTNVPEPGLTYVFRAKHDSFNGKPQLKAKEFSISEPVGRQAIIGYLVKCGRGKGVGMSYANRLYDVYGKDVLDILEKDHTKIQKAGVPIKEHQARTIQLYLKENRKQREVEIKLRDLLNARKFPDGTVKRAMEAFGLKAAEMVKRNPFLLLRFPGCGIKLVDKMYLDLGYDPKSYKRATHLGRYNLTNSDDGSTWFKPVRAKAAMPKVDKAIKLKAIARGIKAKLMTKFRDSKGQWYLADWIRGENEWRCAKKIALMAQPSNRWDRVMKLVEESDLSEHQKKEIDTALYSRIASLTGSPGTGKTFSAARIIDAWKNCYGGNVLALAPTGKAAVRLRESLQGNGVEIPTSTIHSALACIEVETGPYAQTDNKTFDADLIVLDEASMLNTDLFRIVLECIGVNTHLLMIGDPEQLPPIDHGAPLRDIIDSGIPIGKLTEIKRNAGNIVKSCREISEGNSPIATKKMNLDKGENLIELGCTDEKMTDRMEEIIRELAEHEEIDPVWDVQIIVPTNDSRTGLNVHFQRVLNPSSPVEKSIFKKDDKVINLKNEYYQKAEKIGATWSQKEDQEYVANGEIGKVVESLPNLLIVAIQGRSGYLHIPRYATEKETGCDFDLAYAITVHKAQGSQAPFVIVGLPSNSGKKIYSREFLYTAISRAERACFMVGKISLARQMIRTVKLAFRKTFLAERIASRMKFHDLPQQQQTLDAMNDFGRLIEVGEDNESLQPHFAIWA